MISLQETGQQDTAKSQESIEEVVDESIYTKYEPLIVSTGIILVTAFIFILIKDWLKVLLTKQK